MEELEKENLTESVIIDNGTNTTKAGFSDDDMPRVVIPTVLGRPYQNTAPGEKKTKILQNKKSTPKQPPRK